LLPAEGGFSDRLSTDWTPDTLLASRGARVLPGTASPPTSHKAAASTTPWPHHKMPVDTAMPACRGLSWSVQLISRRNRLLDVAGFQAGFEPCLGSGTSLVDCVYQRGRIANRAENAVASLVAVTV
jgi:hypothetical protein